MSYDVVVVVILITIVSSLMVRCSENLKVIHHQSQQLWRSIRSKKSRYISSIFVYNERALAKKAQQINRSRRSLTRVAKKRYIRVSVGVQKRAARCIEPSRKTRTLEQEFNFIDLQTRKKNINFCV